jgi:predicted lipoprotein with Yx(FWY)xxD motif
MRRFLLVALAASAVAVAAQAAGDNALTAVHSERHGAYVADAENRPLYMFTADTKGADGKPAESDCYDACTEAWPPLLAEDVALVGQELKEELVGTIERKDGKTQITYGGWPLYYFVEDHGGKNAAGQDVFGFGGDWYLVSPDGTKNKKNERTG